MLTKSAFKNVTDKYQARKAFNMSSLKGYLGEYTATDLERVFGSPLYRSKDSGDGKVKLEWVLKFDMKDDSGHRHNFYMTVYDWKNYHLNEDDLYSEAVNWHIGGDSEMPAWAVSVVKDQFMQEVFD